MTKLKLAARAALLCATTIAAVALTTTGANADNEDRRVRIINNTSYTMQRFYASNVDTDDWEEDILGNDVLRPGRSVTINIDDGTGHCMYDFKAVFSNGRSLVRQGINVCRITSYTYTD